MRYREHAAPKEASLRRTVVSLVSTAVLMLVFVVALVAFVTPVGL